MNLKNKLDKKAISVLVQSKELIYFFKTLKPNIFSSKFYKYLIEEITKKICWIATTWFK